MTDKDQPDSFKPILLTDEQYGRLVLLLRLGSSTLGFTSMNKSFPLFDIKNYIYSYYNDFNATDLVEYKQEFKVFLPAEKLRRKTKKLIDEYNDHTFRFWLSRVLAHRDQKQKKFDDSALDKVASEYYEELSVNGLKNFYIKEN